MPSLASAVGFGRLLVGIRRLLADPISVEVAERAIEEGVRDRDARFLGLVEGAVYTHARSPYLRLLRSAGIELGDVQGLVAREGIEGTLQELRKAGVYVTFEEFKGRAPAVRGSQRFEFRPHDFANPLITPHYHQRSGGSSGSPTLIAVHLDHIAQSAPDWAVLFAAHGLLAGPLVFWIPSYFWINGRHLMCAKFGKRYAKWFTPVDLGRKGLARVMDGMVRSAGGFTKAEYVPLSRAEEVGAFLAGLVQAGLAPTINTTPSAAVRIVLTMQGKAVLRGVTFLLGAEPVTDARRQAIETSGARAVPTYGFSEGGAVGGQCPHPEAADEVHVFMDAWAIIRGLRYLGSGEEVNPILLTALRPAAPVILLNTEIGDSAVVGTRTCGCRLGRLGCTQVLHTIRSFERLTGEGITVVGADLYPLLERALPERFGGTAADYQLIERQEPTGLPRYELRVSPTVGPLDEALVVRTLLEEIGRIRRTYRFHADMLARGDVVQVRRADPLPTSQGKILPFRTLRAV